MRISLILLVSLLFTSLSLNCGGNPEAQGDDAYADGNYEQALAKFMEVKKSRPDDAKISEKIALSYMKKGLKLYQSRKNIDAFAANFEKGQDAIAKIETGDDFKKEYSKLLTQIALAYNSSEPKNDIQRESYFNKTLQYLEDALINDIDNSEADAALSKIKAANFQKTFDRGSQFLEQAKKEKNNSDLFLSAERSLSRAVSFDPNNAEAQAKLSEVRRKTLSIINMEMDFPLAIADYKFIPGFLLIDMTGINNSGQKMTFDPARLRVVDLDENEYRFDKKQTENYEQGLTEAVPLDPRKRVEGPIAFAIPGGTKIKSLEYELENGKAIKKYFP